MATKNYQSGGPSGREKGTVSVTIKARTKGGDTKATHVRCEKGMVGNLCSWLAGEIRKINEHVKSVESDEKMRRDRLGPELYRENEKRQARKRKRK